MAIVAKEITSAAWVALTTVGQSGSCWLKEDDSDYAQGDGDIRIFHKTTAPGDSDTENGKRIFTPTGNLDVMQISADSGSDIYYARALNTGTRATVLVDAV